MTHGGHSYAGEREVAARQERDALVETAAALRAAGTEVRELSVGSTPTAGPTRWRWAARRWRSARWEWSRRSCRGRGGAVLDCGSKSVSADLRVPGLDGYGMVMGRPEARLARLSE